LFIGFGKEHDDAGKEMKIIGIKWRWKEIKNEIE